MAERKLTIVVDLVNPGGAAKAKAPIKELEREVLASQKRIEAASKATDRAIDSSSKATVSAEAKRNKQKANDFINSLKTMESAAKTSGSKINDSMSSAFKGGLLGGFAGGLVASFTSQISQLPSFFKSQLDQMVQIAAERQNAFKGLESIATFKGISSASAQEAVKSLRLVRAGVIDLGDATTGLKNLLATGFSLSESVRLMEAFSDTAAFGKQSALSFGDAIRSATEGIKNGNSILVDNAGLTKNLSVILKEAGKSEQDLGKVTSDTSVRLALFNGIMKESQGQVGDADKLTQTYTGSVASLDMAYQNLYAAQGNLIIQNPKLVEANKIVTEQITGYTQELGKADSQTAKFGTTITNLYATIKAQTIPYLAFAVKSFEATGLGVGLLSMKIAGAVTGIVESVGNSVQSIVGGAMRSIAELINWTIRQAQKLPQIPGLNNLGMASEIDVSQIPNGSGGTPMTDAIARSTQQFSQQFAETMREAGSILKEVKTNFGRLDRSDNISLAESRRRDDRNTLNSIGGLRRADNTTGGMPSNKYIIVNNERDIPTLVERSKVQSLPGVSGMPDSPSGSKSKGASGGRGSGNTFEKQFRDFADDVNFAVERVKGGAINAKSLHPSGNAGDLRIGGKSNSEIVEALAEGIKRGFRMLDERWVGALPGVKSTGPNIHAERVGSRKASMFVEGRPDIYGGQANLDYLKSLDRKRLAGKNDVTGDVSQFLGQQSDALTKAERERVLLKEIEFHKEIGLMPSAELIKDFTDYLNEDFKKQGKIQLTPEQVKKRQFYGMAERDPGVLGTEIRERDTTANDKQIENLERYQEVLNTLFDAQFNLNEQTELAIIDRQIELGLLPGLTMAQLAYVRTLAAETDTKKATAKANEKAFDDAKQAAEDYREEQKRVFEETEDFFSNKINDFMEGGFKGLWKGILDDMKRNFVKQFSNLLAQAFNPGVQGGQQGGGIGSIFGGLFGGGQSQSGGGLGSIFGNIFGNRGTGGTPPFVPGNNFAGGGASSGGGFNIGSLLGGGGMGHEGMHAGGGKGGLGSIFGPMFAPKKNLLGGGTSKLAGIAGGVGGIASMAGAAIGGKWGNALSMAGTGVQIGSSFGPWGALVGGLIGGGIGIFQALRGDGAEKKLKEAAASQYGINVKDKSVLKQLKMVGEGMFGKGKVGANAAAVVSSEEGQNILKAYADASGQKSDKIDKLNYGDENWSGNQFRSGFGGFSGSSASPGASMSRGYSSVVSTKPSMSFTSANGTPFSSSFAGTIGSGDAQMKVVLGQLEETMNAFATRLETMSPGQVVSMGAKENPAAIYDANLAEISSGGRRAEDVHRTLGVYL